METAKHNPSFTSITTFRFPQAQSRSCNSAEGTFSKHHVVIPRLAQQFGSPVPGSPSLAAVPNGPRMALMAFST